MMAIQVVSGLPPGADYIRILPEVVLAVCGMLVMLLDPVMDERSSQRTLGGIALLGAVAALAATLFQAQQQYWGFGFWNMVKLDAFSVFFHFVVAAVTILVVLSSYEYMEVQQIRAGEYYGLLLFGAVGMDLMSSAMELVLIFIALEISSISTYILAGFRRRSAISSESSVKYFLLGSFATAFFLYGVALMFGATGSTSIVRIGEGLREYAGTQHGPILAYLGIALMFVGLGFKVAAAPFHIWTPDVYEGAPSPVVGFMSTAPKAAVFAVLIRIFFQAQAPGRIWLIWVAAALSMTIGNIAALAQDNVKRLLAYSSIAHAGYLLVAFASLPANGIPAAMFYTAAYAAMNVGAFAVVGHFASTGERYVTLEDYSGLGRRSPALAGILTMFLLSLIGIPITGGFFAKIFVFRAALQGAHPLVGLVIIGVMNSAIASYYYLRVIVFMYMREPREEVPLTPIPTSLALALGLSLGVTIYLGILPNRVLEYAGRSVDLLH
jgi:NADH-quinone oxidoreductase subunit N